jgi:predicted component of type VI protein secretion system
LFDKDGGFVKMKYSNLLKGFIEELDDCYVLMKKKQEDNKLEVEYVFKDLQDQRLGSIKEVMDDITQLIDERKKLRDEIFNDLDNLILKINNFLTEQKDQLKPEEIVDIKRKIVEIEEAKAQEKLNAWRDISSLKKELREHLKEFKDKKDGFKALESMVDL